MFFDFLYAYFYLFVFCIVFFLGRDMFLYLYIFICVLILVFLLLCRFVPLFVCLFIFIFMMQSSIEAQRVPKRKKWLHLFFHGQFLLDWIKLNENSFAAWMMQTDLRFSSHAVMHALRTMQLNSKIAKCFSLSNTSSNPLLLPRNLRFRSCTERTRTFSETASISFTFCLRASSG